MKKIIFSTVLLFAFILVIAACGQKSSIVGTWSSDEMYAVFSPNGDYVSISEAGEEPGTWRDIGSNKIEISSGGVTLTCTYEIKGNNLTLTFEDFGAVFNLTKE